jgi:hypothetical protein
MVNDPDEIVLEHLTAMRSDISERGRQGASRPLPRCRSGDAAAVALEGVKNQQCTGLSGRTGFKALRARRADALKGAADVMGGAPWKVPRPDGPSAGGAKAFGWCHRPTGGEAH